MANKKEVLPEDKPLSIKEKMFIKEYVKNKFNATKAYHKVFPDANDSTCSTNSTRLVKRPRVQKAIALEKERLFERENIELGFIVETLKERLANELAKPEYTYNNEGRIIGKQDGKLIIMITAELSKLAGLYKDKNDIIINNHLEPTKINVKIIKPKD